MEISALWTPKSYLGPGKDMGTAVGRLNATSHLNDHVLSPEVLICRWSSIRFIGTIYINLEERRRLFEEDYFIISRFTDTYIIAKS